MSLISKLEISISNKSNELSNVKIINVYIGTTYPIEENINIDRVNNDIKYGYIYFLNDINFIYDDAAEPIIIKFMIGNEEYCLTYDLEKYKPKYNLYIYKDNDKFLIENRY